MMLREGEAASKAGLGATFAERLPKRRIERLQIRRLDSLAYPWEDYRLVGKWRSWRMTSSYWL